MISTRVHSTGAGGFDSLLSFLFLMERNTVAIITDIDKLIEISGGGQLPSRNDIYTPMPSSQAPWPDHTTRYHYAGNYSFAIITRELVGEIARLLIGKKKVVEVGSGSGWLAMHLRRALDPEVEYVTIDTGELPYPKLWESPTVQGDYVEYDYTGVEVVIMSWPAYECSKIDLVIEKLPQNCAVLLCTEGYGGCIGTDELHDTLNEYPHQKRLINSLSFPGIHDNWFYYSKVLNP